MMPELLPRPIKNLSCLGLISLLALSMACGDNSDVQAPLSELDEGHEISDFSPFAQAEDEVVVDPLFVYHIPDIEAARALFEDDIAHFETSDPFRQVSWMMDSDDVEGLQYRVLQADDSWSDWQEVTITFNEGYFYNALIRLDEAATQMEMRGGRAILSAQLEFYEDVIARHESEWVEGGYDFSPVDEPGDSSEGDDIATISSAIAPSSMVISQSQWGASQPGKICGAAHSPYRVAIHHTGIPSGDGGDPAARMRQMQSYHKNSLGWCDIGYHFVVSQSGLIFQGRSRSGRTGSHVGGQNTGNIGISFIANFSSQTPTQTQLNAGGEILAWVANRYGIALNRTRVRGHREHAGQTTACPGTNMIDSLNALINVAKNGSGPEPTPPPPPPPGGCTPSADENAAGAFFEDFRPTATGYDEAVMLYNAGITQGCSNNPLMFCPNCPLNRAHMVTFLVRAAGLNTSNPPSTPTFSDVPTNHPGYAYVEAAAAAGITMGCGGGNFCPGQEITRAQAATMIHRAAGWPDEVPSTAPTFGDVGTDSVHFAAIETMKQRCVTQGCGNGSNFCPGDTLTRAHGAAFVARAFNLENNNPCAQPGGCSASAAFGTENSVFADFPTTAFGYEESVLLYNEGITAGCTDSPALMFCPNCSTNRRAAVMFLARALNLDTSNPPSQPTFSDLPASATGYAEVEAAVAEGIVQGCSATEFCPNNNVSRAQLATLIARALDWEPMDDSVSLFDDVPTDHPHFEGVNAIADRCVTAGCRADEFCPNGNVSRSHAAIFIARSLDLGGINPCANAPGGSGAGGSGPIVTPDIDDVDADDDDPVLPGETCEDVDPDFIDLACYDPDDVPDDLDDEEIDGDDDGGDDGGDDGDDDDDTTTGQDDDGSQVSVDGGCTTVNSSAPLEMALIGLLLLGSVVLRRPILR